MNPHPLSILFSAMIFPSSVFLHNHTAVFFKILRQHFNRSVKILPQSDTKIKRQAGIENSQAFFSGDFRAPSVLFTLLITLLHVRISRVLMNTCLLYTSDAADE